MSFSSELKLHLQTLGFKKECCMLACSDGYEAQPFHSVCENCRGSFLRGVFFRFGYLAPPEKEPLLTFTFYDDYAEYVKDVLCDAGLNARVTRSKGRNLIYLKKTDDVADVVSLMGATRYSLRMMEVQVDKQFRGELNRKVNAETANLNRTAGASAVQLNAIRKLQSDNKFPLLSDELQAAANLRLSHPEANLSELARLSPFPISKSGLNHRLQKLVELAKEDPKAT
ncbi:MAG: DNA-binding protein WhiA [Clostridiales bacterium]|nr:DNA-binding protein WhiA [Candidatus Coliplasma caballi]